MKRLLQPPADAFEDPASTTNDDIHVVLSAIAKNARERLGHNADAIKCIDALRDAADSGTPLNVLCKLRASMQLMLPEEDRIVAEEMIEQCRTLLGDSLRRLRDPSVPLYPSTVIRHETHPYNGEPWYLASYEYDDVLSGTTGGPHLAYIRVPKVLEKDGEDFHGSVFADNPDVWGSDPVLMRMHSECLLGDIAVGQARCDCGEQFRNAMDRINDNGSGVLFYLRQEGRGVGLHAKMPLLELADGRFQGKWTGKNFDTETAMRAYGHKTMDYRDYRFAARMMRGLGIGSAELITGNPAKVRLLQQSGINVMPASAEASGIAVTLENLMEFLVKIKRGYIIPWSSLINLQHHLDSLHRGERIDDRLFTLFQQLLTYMTEEASKNMPQELKDQLNRVSDRLTPTSGNGTK